MGWDLILEQKGAAMEKHNTVSQQSGETKETDKASTTKQGVVARFFAWIAKGAEKAKKAGTLCGK